jgi:CBS domain-containing protein
MMEPLGFSFIRFLFSFPSDESSHDPYCDIDINSSLKDAISKQLHSNDNSIQIFFLDSKTELILDHKLKRLAIVSQGKLVNILTLTDILKYLMEHNLFGAIGDQTLSSLHLAQRDVVRVLATEPTSKALKLMKQHKINGVAIVDSNDILVGNLSASDLKLLKFDQTIMTTLRAPVQEFMKTVTIVD